MTTVGSTTEGGEDFDVFGSREITVINERKGASDHVYVSKSIFVDTSNAQRKFFEKLGVLEDIEVFVMATTNKSGLESQVFAGKASKSDKSAWKKRKKSEELAGNNLEKKGYFPWTHYFVLKLREKMTFEEFESELLQNSKVVLNKKWMWFKKDLAGNCTQVCLCVGHDERDLIVSSNSTEILDEGIIMIKKDNILKQYK